MAALLSTWAKGSEFVEARKYYSRAASLAPSEPLPQFGLIRTLLQSKEFEEALEAADRGIKRFASDLRWHATFTGYHGIALARLGHLQTGIAEMQASLPWLAADVYLLRELTRAYNQLGDRKNAMRIAIRLRRLEMQ